MAFNTMAAELELQQQLRRQLVADIAHELRTPLSVLRLQIESLEDGIEQPTPEVVAAIEGGVRWLQASAISGIRVERFTNSDGQSDRRVVSDPAAEPVWSRFYELGSNRPIFLGRDSVVHYTFGEIEYERRNGYSYYGTWARSLLEREYPAWKARHRA